MKSHLSSSFEIPFSAFVIQKKSKVRAIGLSPQAQLEGFSLLRDKRCDWKGSSVPETRVNPLGSDQVCKQRDQSRLAVNWTICTLVRLWKGEK